MPKPSSQLVDQLNTLKLDPELYGGEHGGLVDDTGVLAMHEGFEELGEMLTSAEDAEDVRDALEAWPVDLEIYMTYTRIYRGDEAEGRDAGFYEPGGWYYSITDDEFEARAAAIGRENAIKEAAPEPMTFNRLDEAFEYVTSYGTLEPSSFPGWHPGLWYTTAEGNWDSYGDEVLYSFHVEGSPTAQKKLFDALGERGILL